MIEADDYRREAVLRDGEPVTVRQIRPEDRERVADLFDRMGPLSRRRRFGAAKRELTPAELAMLTEGGADRVALAVVSRRSGADVFVGAGHYFVIPGPRSVAEVAFEVGDADQGRGVATVLLEHLTALARGAGMAGLVADFALDNRQMREVFARSGLTVRERDDRGESHVEIAIDDTAAFLCAAADRERIAAAHSVRAVFAPKSVAVIGVSRQAGTIGRAILDNLIGSGLRVPLYAVNPRATDLDGVKCYPTVAAIDAPVDLAIIAVPAAGVEDVVRDCAASGVHAAVIISSGFAELGTADGRAAEARLRAIARAAGMRLVGPNCMGVLSTDPAVRLNATFSPVFPPTGNVSMVTQSGALGLAMLDHARELELGIADFASIGNKADISANDLLSYWHDDPRTTVIALYLESFGNPRRFARLAPEVARSRPIVAVKSGRSAAGTRAASSHSGALASLDVAVDALFAQAGVIRTDTIEQMFDVVSLLASQPVPAGPRVGVITNAGGPGILFADACEANGLIVPKLAPDTVAALATLLPAHAGLHNPIDMTASAPPEHFARALELVGNDPGVDAVVAIYIPPLVTRPEDVAAAIAAGAAKVPAAIPIATVFMSSRGTPSALAGGARGQIPSYSFPENAAIALAAAVRHGAWRRRPRGTCRRLDRDREQAVRAWVGAWTERRPDGGWLDAGDAAALLALGGIGVMPQRLVPAEPDAAVAAARALGYPVAIKAVAPGLLHKTEVGGVVLDLTDDAAVRAAVEPLRCRLAEHDLELTHLLVQRQAAAGLETLVGVTTDPSLGPLVVAGLGGTRVEVDKDVAFRVTPVSDVDAAEMLDQLRGRALLTGFRGAPAVDRAALIDLVQAISALAEAVPELAELDLNPVIVHPGGAGASIVDARIRFSARRPR